MDKAEECKAARVFLLLSTSGNQNVFGRCHFDLGAGHLPSLPAALYQAAYLVFSLSLLCFYSRKSHLKNILTGKEKAYSCLVFF